MLGPARQPLPHHSSVVLAQKSSKAIADVILGNQRVLKCVDEVGGFIRFLFNAVCSNSRGILKELKGSVEITDVDEWRIYIRSRASVPSVGSHRNW